MWMPQEPCARRPDGSDDLLHHLDVLVAAHRADHLRRGVGDRTVALDRPVPPVGHGHLPVVKVAANVPRRRAEVRGDGLGGVFPAYAGGFNLDTESLVFHGVRFFRVVASFSGGVFRPPRPEKKRFLIRQKCAFSPACRLYRRGGLKPYTSRAGCSRFARAAARRAPATGSRPGLAAPRPPRLPRVRPGKPRKPRPPRGLCAPHAGKPARARLPAAARKEGSGSPRPEAPAAPPGTAPCPRRPGETPPAPRPPRHTAASAPPPS